MKLICSVCFFQNENMSVSYEMKSYLFSTKICTKWVTDQAKVHFHHVGKVKGKF